MEWLTVAIIGVECHLTSESRLFGDESVTFHVFKSAPLEGKADR